MYVRNRNDSKFYERSTYTDFNYNLAGGAPHNLSYDAQPPFPLSAIRQLTFGRNFVSMAVVFVLEFDCQMICLARFQSG